MTGHNGKKAGARGYGPTGGGEGSSIANREMIVVATISMICSFPHS